MKTNKKGSVLVPPKRVLGTSKGVNDGAERKGLNKGKRIMKHVPVFEKESLEDTTESSGDEEDDSDPDFQSRQSDADDDEEVEDDEAAEDQAEYEDQSEEPQVEQNDLDSLLMRLLAQRLKNGKRKGAPAVK